MPSVGGSSLPEGSVRSVRAVGEHRSLVGAAETAAPPTEWLRQELKVAAWYGQDAHTSYFLLFYFFTFQRFAQ